MPGTVTPEILEHWRGWIGKTETHAELLAPEILRRFAAAVGSELEVERTPPPLAHWAFFLPTASRESLGPDGHLKRGGFLPPVTLPRRMFAAAEMTFSTPLRLGQEAQMTATIAALKHRVGNSGELVFVEVERTITQNGAACVQERQTIVYRHAGTPVPAVTPGPVTAAPEDAVWTPGAVDLFRFSAVTFNSHRIHYDAAYATAEEGYPGLVVHGPFTAVKLYAHATRRLDRAPRTFAFRATAPLFVDQPILLCNGENDGEFHARRCDQAVGMVVTAT